MVILNFRLLTKRILDEAEFVIQVDQPKLGLPSRDYFLKGRQERAFVAYENFALNLAVSLGANRTQAAKDVADMMQFEIDLAQVGCR